MSKNKRIKLAILTVVLLQLLGLCIQVFSQSASSLGGTVTDTTQGVLAGATVKATNNQTGVVTTTTTNNGGSYNFPSLQPGVYEVNATMQGFQKSGKTEVKLGLGTQSRLNFELKVAGTVTEVEVTSSAENMVLETGSSTGTVLQQEAVTQLPLVTNDVMDLINVMGGVIRAESPIFGASTQTFAGVSGGNINIARDGISVNEIRYASGITSPGRINPEMVGEFKMILSPVDAEMGRGAGQVQMITKSGANAFHGSGVWNIQNTALDANEWGNKNKVDVTMPAWRNLNNYTLSASGPVIKNKTFFFATWDQQIVRSRSEANPLVLTPCARKGIFRYLDGVKNGNAIANPIASDGLRPVVNPDGSVRETYDGVTNALKYKSVLGELDATSIAQLNGPGGAMDDCSAYTFLGGIENLGGIANIGQISGLNTNPGLTAPWDPTYRNAYDTTGYVSTFSALMPPANNWSAGSAGAPIGDGLNTATHRWTRTAKGSDTVFGSGEDNQRKSITFKVDHNINSAHRISGTYSYETDFSYDAQTVWPLEYGGGYPGVVDRQPQTLTAALTSTIRPTMLNEFRVGLSQTRTHTREPLSSPGTGTKLGEVLQALLPNQATLFPSFPTDPLIVGLGSDSANFSGAISHPYGSSRGNLPATWGGVDPRWTFSDTVTWMRGAHSFKGGIEFRMNKSWQESNGAISFGYGGNSSPSLRGGTDWANSPIPNFSGEGFTWAADGVIGNAGAQASGNYPMVNGMMNYMTGQMGTVNQWFYVTGGASAPRWNNPGAAIGTPGTSGYIPGGESFYVTDLRNKELSFFVKDDWKVTNSLTFNLGMRYEYYGVPSVANGMTAGVQGGMSGLFGGSGSDFSAWMPETPQFSEANLTEQIFIGPNSTNSGMTAFNRDLNNFAPHVGFAWQLPWFGKGKTTLRGGYSISYSAVGNFTDYATTLANNAGMTYTNQKGTDTAHPYYNLTNIGSIVPTPIAADIIPITTNPEPVYKRDQTLSLYDSNIRNPYIQNLTLSLTRNIGNALTVDVRYVGTLSRKNVGAINLNAPNFMNLKLGTSTYMAEMATIRAGGQSTILNGMFPNYKVTGDIFGFGADMFVPETFSDQLRNSYMYWQNLANGDFGAIAATLATENGTVPTSSSTERGLFLRENNQPANLFTTNPQYAAVNLTTNRNHSNYHSMQVQLTMRPTRGLSLQTTYTWSRNLANPGTPTDWRNPSQDYWLSDQHRLHTLSSYGTFDLPMGANGFIFRNAGGAFKKAVEGWQVSWISNVTSGMPGSIAMNAGWSSNNTLWGNAAPNLVGSFDSKGGTTTWLSGAANGRYFGDKYMKVDDPACTNGTVGGGPFFLPTWLADQCKGSSGLGALALVSTGEIVFQNPAPGTRGNFLPNSLTGPGRWSLDMAMSKSIEFMEGKRIDFRIDAQNIFNHATPGDSATSWNARYTQIGNPNFNLNTGDTFGMLSTKGGHRTFQAKIRISF